MSDGLDKAVMNAFIPPLQSAIRTGGDGMRVTIEIPESDMGEAAKLLAMRGKQLKVTIQILTNLDDETEKGPEGSGDKVGRRRLRDRRNK